MKRLNCHSGEEKVFFPRLFSDQGVESLATFPEGHNRRQAAGIVGEGEN